MKSGTLIRASVAPLPSIERARVDHPRKGAVALPTTPAAQEESNLRGSGPRYARSGGMTGRIMERPHRNTREKRSRDRSRGRGPIGLHLRFVTDLLRLLQPVAATLDGRPAVVLDLSMDRAVVEHSFRLAGPAARLSFGWEGEQIDQECIAGSSEL